MPDSAQSSIDAAIQVFYESIFDEDARLTERSAAGPLEFQRTQELLRTYLDAGRILDIGGGTGTHSVALREQGFDVVLVDPVARHVASAAARSLSASLGDARQLRFNDNTFDAALLLGPLYHLADATDRQLALREAARVTAPGGFVFAAALSRFIAFGAISLGSEVPLPYPESWVDVLAHGQPPEGLRFPAGHFHTAEELHTEVEAAGLEVLDVVGVEGPAGLLLEEMADVDASLFDAALRVARAASNRPGIRDISSHLLAIARVPTPVAT